MKTYLHPLLILLSFLSVPLIAQAQPTALEIIQKANDKFRGDNSVAELKMTIIRPSWTREMTMKAWSRGNDYSLVLVTAPARDEGTGFLKRENEIWNWQPTIDRVIKMPPSMMSQSWLGSDFTNDDLVQESSIVTDFSHTLIGTEEIDGNACYKIEMIPHEDAVVVWGKVITWVSKEHYLQLKSEFYDEEGYLVNTMYGKDIKDLGGRTLASKMEVIPADEEGHRTVMEYLWIDFGEDLPASFFSVQNMKRLSR
jgi:outer membrane lipoprotein-sorting protein